MMNKEVERLYIATLNITSIKGHAVSTGGVDQVDKRKVMILYNGRWRNVRVDENGELFIEVRPQI